MAGEKPESSGFLALIDARIAALQQLRESLIAAISIGALGQFGEVDMSAVASMPPANGAVSSGQSSAGPIDLPTGVFRDKGLADAIRMYLSIAKRKQTAKEIKTALMEGGLATTATFFDATLAGTLHRMKRGGELLQFKDGWDLAASYPENFRQRMAQNNEDTPKRRRKRKTGKPAKASKAERGPKKATPKAGEPKLDDASQLRAAS